METTRTFFERRLQTVFQVTPTLGAEPIGLTLHAIHRFPPRNSTPTFRGLHTPPNTAFTLLFHGPLEPILEQCIYSLRPKHAPTHLPDTFCYLVPLGLTPTPSTMQYSALFETSSSNS